MGNLSHVFGTFSTFCHQGPGTGKTTLTTSSISWNPVSLVLTQFVFVNVCLIGFEETLQSDAFKVQGSNRSELQNRVKRANNKTLLKSQFYLPAPEWPWTCYLPNRMWHVIDREGYLLGALLHSQAHSNYGKPMAIK